MFTVDQRPQRKRLSWESRCEIVWKVREQGMTARQAAATSGVHRATVYRLLARFDRGGYLALRDRSSRPLTSPRRLSAQAEAQIIALRARTRYGPRRLGPILDRPASSVGKVLRRHGLSGRPRPARQPAVRYEHPAPGELLHVDSKRLGRFHHVGKRILKDGVTRSANVGWHHLHVAVDDHTRLAYCEVLAGQGRDARCAFMRRAVTWFTQQGITVRRVLTDNGHAYRSHAWRALCAQLGITHKRTRPYTPRTNGKAEAFIGTALREWAYRYPYPSSTHRTRALPGWVRW